MDFSIKKYLCLIYSLCFPFLISHLPFQPNSMSNLFLTILLPTFIFLIFIVLSRRRNNRLPPGPNPWPIIGNLPHMGPKPHQTLAAMVTTYGPILHLRLGFADVVVAASKSVAEQFLKVHDANFASRPPNSGAKHMGYNYQDLVFAPYGQRWRMLRKISSVHLFSAKALEDFKHVRQVKFSYKRDFHFSNAIAHL